uniref:Gamma-butyrobetaine dioxygenase n=1 Tax=Clastoptera arizonana TaxID=38151 RepID=A0A1B6E3F2_9HEMI
MFKLQSLRVRLKNELKRFAWTTQIIGENISVQDNEIQEEYRFPYIWLRDNCQCSECFHTPSKSRIINAEHFDFDIKPQEIEVLESRLKVKWSDNHLSYFTISWLKNHRFSSKHQKYWLHNVYRPCPQPWRANEFSRILQRFNYNDVLKREDTLLSWLESLAIWGVALIKDAGVKENTLLGLCNRVAFVKHTQYGNIFGVKAKPGTSNVAYLSGPLQLHTDLPYYEYKPGVLMLHCLIQASENGGENQLSDGLAVCTDLKQNFPNDYKILANTPVDWSDIVEEDNKQYYSLYRAPVISENPNGDLVRINFSQPQRDSHFNIPLEQIIPWYKAYKRLVQTLHNPKYKVFHRLKQGDILTFDNLRLPHGRSSYDGERYLQGCYMDWDHVYSKMRILKTIAQNNQS